MLCPFGIYVCHHLIYGVDHQCYLQKVRILTECMLTALERSL